MLKLSGELITDLNLIIQVKMMFVFQICSDIKLMDKQSTDDSHFKLGKDFIVIDCTTEISINPVNQKLFFLNLPVRTVEIKFAFLIYIIVFS